MRENELEESERGLENEFPFEGREKSFPPSFLLHQQQTFNQIIKHDSPRIAS
jgi:hypothetical protein